MNETHPIAAPLAGPILTSLGEQITELVAHIDAAQYQLMVLLKEFDEKEEWADEGIHSCAHWLNIYCGISMGAGRERVRVARALPTLPQISDAFRKGEVSYSKVRAMTRVATPNNEPVLLNTARYGTANDVELQVRHYRKNKRLENLKQDNIRFAQRKLTVFQDDDNTWVVRGRLTEEQGELLSKALELGAEQLFAEQCGVPHEVEEHAECSHPANEPKSDSASARRADAMERMAMAFLASSNSQANGGDAFLVNIHTNVDELTDVSAETPRRHACDASVIHWLNTEAGEPLSIERKSRTIPPAIRRALRRRDGGCRFPGCTCTRFVDAHHIHHWADGGETSMENLVLLCRRHHRLVHEEGYGINVLGRGQFQFTMPTGRVLEYNRHGRFRGNVFALRARNRDNHLDIHPFTANALLDEGPMDHQMGLDTLIQRE